MKHLNLVNAMLTSLPHTEESQQILASAKPALRDLCRKYHIQRLMVFGSAISGTRTPESDIDLLVEFKSGKTPGFAFARIAGELTVILGAPVDLHAAASLSKYFRHQVVAEARVVYAEEE
jgi:predicted nucleotidyltransferase